MKQALFDAHCDTAFQLLLKGEALLENSGHFDLRRGVAYAPHARFFALFPMTEEEGPTACPPLSGLSLEQVAWRELELLLEEFEKNSGLVRLCRTAGEAESAAREGKLAAFLSLEGAEGLGCSLDGLRRFYDLGVRAVNPVWNRDNALCGSCATGKNLGFTEEGKAFVRLAEELGVILDVSHMSERSFWDLCGTVKGPIMSSHSNARALCGHPRNLTDEQFRELCRGGGVAGLNLYTAFLTDRGSATVQDAVRHVLHFLELGGEEHIAIGTDFDGCDSLPEGLEGVQHMGVLIQALQQAGLTDEMIEKIFYRNLLRLVGDVCGI